MKTGKKIAKRTIALIIRRGFFGLFIAIGLLSGCGDNPCDNGEPDTCANIANTAPNSCMVIVEDDFACLCQNVEEQDRCYQWNEGNKTCDPTEC